MSPEINPFDQPISALRNLTQTKKDETQDKTGSNLNSKKIDIFKEEMAWQKELESEDSEFMKDVKIDLIGKLEKVLNHLKEEINNPNSSQYQKEVAQEELEKRITQQNRLLSKYKNDA